MSRIVSGHRVKMALCVTNNGRNIRTNISKQGWARRFEEVKGQVKMWRRKNLHGIVDQLFFKTNST